MSAPNETTSQSTLAPTMSRAKAEDHTLRKFPWRPGVTPWSAIINHPYEGNGTLDSPYLVDWLPDSPSPQEEKQGKDEGVVKFHDSEQPLTWSGKMKWTATAVGAWSVLAVTMASSMLSAAIFNIHADFPGYTQQMYVMITSAFVLGFVVGPLLWAPMSEVFGRRNMFLLTYVPFTIFNAACCGAPNLEALLVLRFFAGTFGSSSLTNTGGIIADMFNAAERGKAMGLFAAAPFLGPAIGPVAGGFLAENASWRWVAAVIAIFSAFLTILGILWLPETYGTVLLRRRAARLSKYTGKVYRSRTDIAKPVDTKSLFLTQLQKPWELLYKEPIVFLMAIYMSIIYAILYMQFSSFPIVFQLHRGWSPGIGGLAFVGITIGAMLALVYLGVVENPRYTKKLAAQGGWLPPEERLPAPILGAVLFPVGLIWFAWTCAPNSIHWIAPILSTVFFGAGLVMLFLGLMGYLVDAYLVYAASVLAGNTVIRSIFGVVFPLFTSNIFNTLGLNWGGTLIAGIALIFTPAPIIFYKYGRRIRRSSPYARKADDIGQMMAEKAMAARRAAESGASGERKESAAASEDTEKQAGMSESHPDLGIEGHYPPTLDHGKDNIGEKESAAVLETELREAAMFGGGEALALQLSRAEAVESGTVHAEMTEGERKRASKVIFLGNPV